MTIRTFLGLFREAYKIWLEDRAQRLGAALAYYAMFSIAPLLVIVIAIAGLVFDEDTARSQIVSVLTTQVVIDCKVQHFSNGQFSDQRMGK